MNTYKIIKNDEISLMIELPYNIYKEGWLIDKSDLHREIAIMQYAENKQSVKWGGYNVSFGTTKILFMKEK